MDKELLNGSGAKDPTPYEAMKNMGPQPGEIYKRGTAFFLVVNSTTNGMYCPVLQLVTYEPFDIEKNPDRWMTIEDDNSEVFYTDVSMLRHDTTNSLKKKYSELSEESLELVRDAIADALGIRVKVTEPVSATLEVQEDEGVYKKLYDDLIDKLIAKGRM